MLISLGTGLDGGPRRRAPAPAPGAPALVRPPALLGTGRIGAPLEVDPGDWTGAAGFGFAWLRNGAPIAGAAGAGYVPAAEDDRAALACRVTAVGAGGRTAAETPAVAVVFPPPQAAGVPPDLILTQGTGTRILDASPFFSGSALRFSIAGDGVAIDPATGVVTVSLDALRAGAPIRVAAENSGGRAELGFTLKVLPAEVAPILTREPALAGSGRVGAALEVDPGLWGGEPAPELALQWLRDGAPIEGATAARFIPGDADDGAAVAVRVTARNVAGSLAAETAAIRVTREAPAATGWLEDVVLAQGAAQRRVEAGRAFAGAGLRFAVAGGGATIDAQTGVVALPTGTARAAETVTVTATNSGGAASVAFALSVLAAPRLTGAPADVVAAVGETRTVDVGALVAPRSGLVWTSNRPAWPLSAAGVLTIPTAAALAATSVSVTAADVLGQAATATFQVTVRPAAPVLTAPVGNVAATVGEARTVDVGALVAPRSGLVWTSNRPAWALSAAGVLTIPTAAAFAATSVSVTAADAFGQSVTATFQVTVAAVPMSVTAPPSFAAATPPGTALGSVWNVAGGAYAGGVAPFTLERRFLRDGAAIAAFGAATSYTVVAADQGKTITAELRRTDSSVPPQVLTFGASGSAVIPAAVAPMSVTAPPSFAAATPPGTALGSVWNVAGGAYAGGVAPFTLERRFLRDGAAIAAFGAATSYTVVAADQGKTITAELRRADSSVPPQVLTFGASGSAVIPATQPAADFVVSNSAQLLTVMITAAGQAGPKLIICEPGNYAALNRGQALVKQGFTTVDGRRSNPNNRVTIRARNRSDAAVANQTRFLNNEMTFTGLSGFDFEGVVWERTAKDGVNYGAGDPRNSKIGGMAGFPAAGNTCMTMTQCDNIRFLNCRIIGGHRTCSWQQANTRITYERCSFEGIGMDGVSMFADGNWFIAFLYNKFREDVDFVRAPSDEPNRHPDSFSVQAPSGQDLTWIGNDIRSGPGYMQGPFVPNAEVRDGAMAWADGKQWRLTVRLNYVECRHTNAFVIGPADGSDISDNVLRTRNILAGEVEGVGGGIGIPNLNLSGRHANGFCGRNITPRAVRFINGAAATQWTGLNTNVVSDTAWPAAFPNNAPHPAGVYSA